VRNATWFPFLAIHVLIQRRETKMVEALGGLEP
jgi:hypothetical protein